VRFCLACLAACRTACADTTRPSWDSVALNCTEAQSLASLVPDLAPDSPLPSGAPTLILYPNHNVRFLDDAAYWCVVVVSRSFAIGGTQADLSFV
jgi:hypothetical protein